MKFPPTPQRRSASRTVGNGVGWRPTPLSTVTVYDAPPSSSRSEGSAVLTRSCKYGYGCSYLLNGEKGCKFPHPPLEKEWGVWAREQGVPSLRAGREEWAREHCGGLSHLLEQGDKEGCSYHFGCKFLPKGKCNKRHDPLEVVWAAWAKAFGKQPQQQQQQQQPPAAPRGHTPKPFWDSVVPPPCAEGSRCTELSKFGVCPYLHSEEEKFEVLGRCKDAGHCGKLLQGEGACRFYHFPDERQRARCRRYSLTVKGSGVDVNTDV